MKKMIIDFNERGVVVIQRIRIIGNVRYMASEVIDVENYDHHTATRIRKTTNQKLKEMRECIITREKLSNND